MGKENRKYTEEFKLESLRLAKERPKSLKQIAIDLGIPDNTLRYWHK